MIKKIHTTIFLFLLTIQFANAQSSWQWGITGGGISDTHTQDREEVTKVVTDRNGNVYAMTRITNSPTYLKIDGRSITLPSSTSASLIFSYKCDGTFRWGKVAQFRGGATLAVDTLGGLYIAGNISSNNFFLGSLSAYDADTFFNIMSSDMKTLVLVKLDTLGNKQWIRTPQPDTVSASSPQSASMDMTVESNGTIHWLCELTPGNYQGSGLVLTDRGIHALRYDRYGNLIGNTPIGLVTSASYISPGYATINYTKGNNRYIIAGAYRFGDPALTIGGTPVTQPLYIASFDATSGSFNWLRQASGAWAELQCKPTVDNSNDIYLTATLGIGYTFNGFTQTNSYTTILNSFPFIQKIDASGTAVWTHNVNATQAGAIPLGIALSGNEIAVTGNYGSKFKWDNGTDSLFSNYTTFGINVFLTRFNSSTGSYIKTDTLKGSTAGSEYPFSLCGDRNGSYYVGGRFETNISFTGTPIYSAGGVHDFFLAKFGSNNCSFATPLVGINEIALQNSISVYPNPANGTTTIALLKGVNNASIKVTNMIGQIIAEKGNQSGDKFTLDISQQAPGIYFFEVEEQGHVWREKVVKQ